MSGGVIEAAWIEGLCQGIPVLLAAGVAWKALDRWRTEAKGRRRLQVAEDCLFAASGAMLALKEARRPPIHFLSREQIWDENRETPQERDWKFIQAGFSRAQLAIEKFEVKHRLASLFIADLPRIPSRDGTVMRNAPEEFEGILVEMSGLLRTGYHEITYTDAAPSDISDYLKARDQLHGFDTWPHSPGAPFTDDIGVRLKHAMQLLEDCLRPELQAPSRSKSIPT